ncbi:uncharacterized protein SCDLUD_003942 [Saccharomycodes ludwigii]|uniref:uncharacterized protein n=1 Tax=Saccharomycodes ludwigii TaxID=36035 RepID=UPI001E8B52CB|nr:hypothetical protein SCDLUD_003942 [Saccharomycodes ludwigii]KAH3899659.1 hypothetical protein SCDLUD_003942 [Saccharomycodes ludwigii]
MEKQINVTTPVTTDNMMLMNAVATDANDNTTFDSTTIISGNTSNNSSHINSNNNVLNINAYVDNYHSVDISSNATNNNCAHNFDDDDDEYESFTVLSSISSSSTLSTEIYNTNVTFNNDSNASFSYYYVTSTNTRSPSNSFSNNNNASINRSPFHNIISSSESTNSNHTSASCSISDIAEGENIISNKISHDLLTNDIAANNDNKLLYQKSSSNINLFKILFGYDYKQELFELVYKYIELKKKRNLLNNEKSNNPSTIYNKRQDIPSVFGIHKDLIFQLALETQ